MTERPGVAAFDFDGTLTRRDTLIPFLVRASGWHRVGMAVAAAALRHRTDRDALKVAMVGRLFEGWPESRLARLGADYAASRLPTMLRPEMVQRLRWHQSEGHAAVIVSAGLGVYLRPMGEQLGLDEVIAVELAGGDGDVGDEKVLTGAVVGEVNNRGDSKIRRLREWTDRRFGEGKPIELWAYGDSSGDAELLAAADHPTWVGRRAAR